VTSQTAAVGEVTMHTEGRIAVITVHNEAKKNSYSPEMMEQLSDHLTAFEDDDDLWVAVFCAEGKDTTAGLDMPKFFGPTATARPQDPSKVDPFGLGRRCTKPVIAVVQGLTFTIGIEMMLAADIVVAADTAQFQQLECKRGIAPFGGAHFRYLTRTGWGNAMYHLFLCDKFDAATALQMGLSKRLCRSASTSTGRWNWPARSAKTLRSVSGQPKSARWHSLPQQNKFRLTRFPTSAPRSWIPRTAKKEFCPS